MLDRPGRIVYIPPEEFDVSQPNPKTYHVANSISEFLEVSARLADELVDEV
jgi:hypothetical protein